MVVQIKCSTLEDNADFKISNRELELSVLSMIKLLHGDFGAGAIQTCFKGTNSSHSSLNEFYFMIN